MARIRTIKPEFWTSDQVASCSRDARLLFIGIWNFCDDAGIHPFALMRLKMEIFPGDNCKIDEISRWLDELIAAGLIVTYEADSMMYLQVTGWRKHQKIDKPTYRFPQPGTYLLENLPYQIKSNLIPLGESSTNTHRLVTTGMESKGMECKGTNICEVSVETSSLLLTEQCNEPEMKNKFKPLSVDERSDVNAQVQEVFNYWQVQMGRSKAKLDKKRKNKITMALKDFSVEELKQAINGCKNTPHNMGQNAHGLKYDELELILRNVSNIERFMNNFSRDTNTNLDKKVSQIEQLMQGAI